MGELRSISKDVSDEELKDVATVSAGGNERIGQLISDAMQRVGRQGVVTMEESKTAGGWVGSPAPSAQGGASVRLCLAACKEGGAPAVGQCTPACLPACLPAQLSGAFSLSRLAS